MNNKLLKNNLIYNIILLAILKKSVINIIKLKIKLTENEQQQENEDLEQEKCQNICSWYILLYRISFKLIFKKKYVKNN